VAEALTAAEMRSAFDVFVGMGAPGRRT
jgi:hypothetical protein